MSVLNYLNNVTLNTNLLAVKTIKYMSVFGKDCNQVKGCTYREKNMFVLSFELKCCFSATPFTVATMFCNSIIFVIFSIHTDLTLNINTRPIGFFLTSKCWQMHALMPVGSFFVLFF